MTSGLLCSPLSYSYSYSKMHDVLGASPSCINVSAAKLFHGTLHKNDRRLPTRPLAVSSLPVSHPRERRPKQGDLSGLEPNEILLEFFFELVSSEE